MEMLVKTTCPICHCDTYLMVDAEEYARWQAGELIQNAMPDMTSENREMLISGICPRCWEDMFGYEYEDEYDDDDEDEEAEDYPEPDDLEMGFNPYMGCYDFDC